MKILKRAIESDRSGYIYMLPEEIDDMWHAYNLIQVGDQIQSRTMRRIQKGSIATESQRIQLTLRIEVSRIEFDPSGCELRITGQNVLQSEHVKMGQFHTMTLERNRAFSINKPRWDAMHFEHLDLATDPRKSAEVACVLMGEGLAHICLITHALTHVRQRISMPIPRKNARGSTHGQAMTRFYDAVICALQQHVDFEVVKCVVVASPAFIKDDFYKYMLGRPGDQCGALHRNRSKFVLVHSSSGHMQVLKEVLAAPAVQHLVQDTKAAGEVHALNAFYEMLSQDPDRALYGPRHVAYAHSLGAIQTLLLSDSLFRNADVRQRQHFVRMVQEVRRGGGSAHVFSQMHVSGEQLAQLTGIACITRYPLPDADDVLDEDDA
eukprot:gnl/Trimastix_PCT/3493.p1 GENE.gnl/Trimastix_PCT/3493~~gnl/Trimastix_PCT/3493.p1  ORF type:complete len:379 (+),score=115.49 gnl/Trimastix_PCT/3493:58-1194(+)